MNTITLPLLTSFYRDYLRYHDLSRFISRTAKHYTQGTLCRLADARNVDTRRAAALILGFVGTYASNRTLGKLLTDRDRSTALLAETSIKSVWSRDGSEEQRHILYDVMRCIAAQNYAEAVRLANILLEEEPLFAEVRNQRAIALFALGQFQECIDDSTLVLELNPYHFGAAIGMGHAYLQTDSKEIAVMCFQHALKINPNLDSVRRHLERMKMDIR
ncbi:MAG: tetratricopeptide repeat protein [Planctomycetaceae bacterium]|jgi:tetratricopeptide (TPR) repeat protein|nr:tetratricopeptide repeat protein [Planctomycetaceae bacterium]